LFCHVFILKFESSFVYFFKMAAKVRRKMKNEEERREKVNFS